MIDEILRAVALLRVIEGIMPFLSPAKWRETMQQISQQPDSVLRGFGLASMIIGVIFLYALS
ncbi:MAG: DUF2065 domain-containing protein [Gammaproteobacteria bacterium]|nr:DUF2065 domain-containing protein [Gammaproteobacteria bacterium]